MISKSLFRVFFTSFLSVLVSLSAYAAPDATKVEGPESCGECHGNEVEAWKLTHHFSTFNEMHRTPEAREIASKLGIQRIKHESLCLTCHYTSKELEGGKLDVIAGISCESCHGAAKDWINVHNDYGDGQTKETESAEHRKERLEKSVANGMISPDDIYAVASNCYECHMVPNEELVNVGGHPAGSKGFELVSWLHGEVLHNFQSTEGKSNADNSAEKKRMLFLISIVLELENSLRGTAIATSVDTYGKKMASRANKAKKKLGQVGKLVSADELTQIYEIASGVKLTVNNKEELMAAADKVGELGRAFSKAHDGSAFGALDKYIAAAKVKGEVYQP